MEKADRQSVGQTERKGGLQGSAPSLSPRVLYSNSNEVFSVGHLGVGHAQVSRTHGQPAG